jgi:hypothetical protein
MVDAALTQGAVSSPCVDVCRLDAQGICIGCRRTLAEIAEWSRASEGRRREILHALAQRKTGV